MKSSKHHRAQPVAIGRPNPLKVIYRRIDELKPDPANPRRHSKKQIRQIADSIEAFGFNVPILIDRDGNVIAGSWPAAGLPRARLDRGADAVPRSPHPGAGPRLHDRRQPADRDRHLGRPAAGAAAQGSLAARPRFQPRGHRLRDGRDRSADRIARGPARARRRPGRCAARIAGGPAGQQDRRFVAPRSPSRVVRQCPRCRGLRRADGRGTRRDGLHRPALQRADRWSCERPRRDPPSPLPDGLGRDGPGRIHRLSRPGFPQPRGIQRRRLAALRLHGLAPCRRAAGRRPRASMAS